MWPNKRPRGPVFFCHDPRGGQIYCTTFEEEKLGRGIVSSTKFESGHFQGSVHLI